MIIKPSIMDFEASGLGPSSYPIEVGYCGADGERYCTLIRPEPDWTHWDEDAAKLHGISRQTLCERGMPVSVVAEQLNERLSGQVLYSDGWVVDSVWLSLLFESARLVPAFQLRAIEHIQTECQYHRWDQVKAKVLEAFTERRHRASSDAYMVQLVFERSQNHCEMTRFSNNISASAVEVAAGNSLRQ